MRTKLAVLAVSTAAFFTALVMPAFAVHAASCGWRTDGVAFISPTYGEVIWYVGHTVIGGHYYRTFSDHDLNWNFLHYSVVYCG